MKTQKEFCEIFTLLLTYIVPVKSKVEISQHFVAFSEYMNIKVCMLMNIEQNLVNGVEERPQSKVKRAKKQFNFRICP